MPFARPTLTDIRVGVAADINSSLKGADALLRFANLKIMGDVQARLAHDHYGYLDYIAKQSNPFTSTDEYLAAWGALKQEFLKDAQAAQLTATFAATAGTIEAGTEVNRGDGFSYTVTESVAYVSGNSITVPITASVTGSDGNADNGTSVTLGVSVDFVNSTGVIASTVKSGTDVEDEDDFKSRVLNAYANPPQGGADGDYPTWALQVPGVTRAWCVPNQLGAGTVLVYAMMDNTEANHGGFLQGSDGVATNEKRAAAATGDQLQIANYIYPLRPATALVTVASPTPNVINFEIGGMSTASADVKAAVAAAISGVFILYGDPEEGTIEQSYLEAAIASISGTKGFLINSPAGNITGTMGQLPVLGTVDYVE